MKNLKIFMPLYIVAAMTIMIAALSVSGKKSPLLVKAETTIKDTIKDTVYVPVFDYEMKNNMIDEMNHLRDSLFVERYKIERIKYYLKIVQHNPTQLKFLRGWILRVVK